MYAKFIVLICVRNVHVYGCVIDDSHIHIIIVLVMPNHKCLLRIAVRVLPYSFFNRPQCAFTVHAYAACACTT